jgi:hypothetical protein
MGEMRNLYKVLVREPEGKKPLGRTRSRWKYSINLDIMEMGWEGVDWIHLVQERDQWRAVVKTVTNLRVQLKAGNFLTS